MTKSLRKICGRNDDRIRNLLNTSRTAYPTDLADPVENLLDIQDIQTDFCRSYEKKMLQRMFFILLRSHE